MNSVNESGKVYKVEWFLNSLNNMGNLPQRLNITHKL